MEFIREKNKKYMEQKEQYQAIKSKQQKPPLKIQSETNAISGILDPW